MDRHAVLVALGNASLLTSERSWIVRTASPRHLRAALLEWNAPTPALLAADLPPCVLRSRHRPLTLRAIQKLVDDHLTQLGLTSIPISSVSGNAASHTPVSQEWLSLLTQTNQQRWESLPYTDYPPRVVQVICRGQEPIYAPLLSLIEQAVHPYGPTRDLSSFLVVRL